MYICLGYDSTTTSVISSDSIFPEEKENETEKKVTN